jgi:uncharacterized protein DUF4154
MTPRWRCASAIVGVALAMLLYHGSAVEAQEVAVPVDVQVPLMAKILAFDRKLGEHTKDDVVLGVLYQGRFRMSASVAQEVQDAVKRLAPDAVVGRRMRSVAIDLDETPDLGATLTRHGVTVLYVTPLRAADLGAISVTSRSAGITTMTGVPSYVETGLAIGIGMRGTRPEIVINLVASRAEGADLNAQLLKLARIVH